MKDEFIISTEKGIECGRSGIGDIQKIKTNFHIDRLKLRRFESIYHSVSAGVLRTIDSTSDEDFSFDWYRVLKKDEPGNVGVYGVFCHADNECDVLKMVNLYKKCAEIDYYNKNETRILLLDAEYLECKILLLIEVV